MSLPPAAPLAADLLSWYATAHRDLPWRRDPTPYKVLLSELMLQQTRVDTVLPYFERFVSRWPTIAAFAAASEGEIVEAWAGLGYYSRARNLHRCAVAAGGALPSDPEALRALPGIGPYTAGAIASIAFGVKTPTVDGNVERVLSRIDGRVADPRSKAGREALWARATALHEAAPEGSHPGDLNQALMELGATVCAPKSPACGRCPVAAACVGRATGIAESLPRLTPKPKPVPIAGIAGIARAPDGKVLLGRRATGLLAGLWEPIRADVVAGEAARDALTAAFAALGLTARIGPQIGSVTHVFTHRRLVCAVHPVAAAGAPTPGGAYDGVGYADPEAVGCSKLALKLLDADRAPALLAAEPPPAGPR